MNPQLIVGIAMVFGLANIATAAVAFPDLVPNPSRLATGVVWVRNEGNELAVPSILTINCHQPGMLGGCVDIPAADAAYYTDARFPDRLVVKVPELRPGRRFRHRLPFWAATVWPSGTYHFDFVADADDDVVEGTDGDGEANNAPPPFVKVVP